MAVPTYQGFIAGKGRLGGGGGMGGGMGGRILGGAPPRDYNKSSGGIPGVTNPAGTIVGNLGNLSGIINQLTSTQLDALRNQYPDEYFSTLGTLLGNVGKRAAGDISDLLPELQTKSAEAAVGGGFSGSGMENSKLLRDLGLTRYKVEQEALDSLSKIQGQIPKVNPFDPSAIIAALIDAQQRADIYNAAPSPEEAYRRAKAAAGGGGGGGGGTGGFRFGSGGGGGGGGVDDALRRPTGYPPPIIAHGTKVPDVSPGLGPVPYGSIPFFNQPGLTDADKNFDPLWDTDPFGTREFENEFGFDTSLFDLDPINDTKPYSGGGLPNDFDPWNDYD